MSRAWRTASNFWRSDTALVTSGSVFSRLSILLLYLIAARTLVPNGYAFLAYIVGVSTFLQIILDPSSLAAFVVTAGARNTLEVRRGLVRTGVKLMRLSGVIIVVTLTLIGALVSGTPAHVVTSLSVGLLASGESVARFARTEWQIDHKFRKYASIDILLGWGRILTGVVLLLTHSLIAFAVANLILGVVWQAIPWITRTTKRIGSGPNRGSTLGMVREVWPYSASYLSAAIYSNGPAVIVGLFGGVSQGALYSIVSRLTQPTELVPQALLAVNLPLLTKADDVSRPVIFRKQAIQAGLGGLLIAGGLLLTAPLTLRLFRLPLKDAFPLLVVLAAILPLKFLSYQLVALVMAEGNIRSRLRVGACVAILSVVGVSAVAWDGALAAAVVTLGCECLLVTLLYQAAKDTAQPALFHNRGRRPVVSE